MSRVVARSERKTANTVKHMDTLSRSNTFLDTFCPLLVTGVGFDGPLAVPLQDVSVPNYTAWAWPNCKRY